MQVLKGIDLYQDIVEIQE